METAVLATLEQSLAAVASAAAPQDAMAAVLGAMASLSGASLAQIALPAHRARVFASDLTDAAPQRQLGPSAAVTWDEELLETSLANRDGVALQRVTDGMTVFPISAGAVLLLAARRECLDHEPTRRALYVLAYQADALERSAYELREAHNRIEAQEKLQTELLERNMALRERSMLDELTGLYNRRFFERSLAYELERFHRYGHPLGVILIDIDHFKIVNDTHGHETGDLVLRHVARVLRETVRTADLVVRYGGEELILLVPDTDLAGTQILAERLRARIESTPFDVAGFRLVVTVSIGATAIEGHFNGTMEEVLRSTDAALYKAKDDGRNRVHIASL